MPAGDTATLLAEQTDAIRNESAWLKEQAARITDGMDRAWPIMRQARYRIRDLEQALLEMTITTRAETPKAEKAFEEARRLLNETR